MSFDEIVSELVVEYQVRRENGEAVALADVCRGREKLLPEVERRLRELASIRERIGRTSRDSTAPGSTGADSTHRTIPSAAPKIPGYELLSLLGQGGMGVVYKARDVALDRLVAIKMIVKRGNEIGAEQLSRFRAEAEAVARLNHSGIVQIYSVGEHDGSPYLALEYVDGGHLGQRVADRPLPARQAAEVVESLAQAIQVAHDKGIVHRDLKPQNVLLTTGTVTFKIGDFGLAKKLDAADGPTVTGDIMGTPNYMAPEQARGQTEQIGPLADVYALGGILYFLLTCQPPFRGATVLDTIQQVVDREPTPPSHFNAKVPRDLETICLKCLQKDPRRRYFSAQALADELRRFREGKPILARPVGTVEKMYRWSKRSPVAASLIAAIFLTLTISSIVASMLTVWAMREAARADGNAEKFKVALIAEEKERANAVQSLRFAEAQSSRAEVAESEAKAKAADERRAREDAEFARYRQAIYLADREREANLLGRASVVLDELASDPELAKLCSWEWHYLKRSCSRTSTFAKLSRTVNELEVSRDGGLLACAADDGSILISSTLDGRPIQTLNGIAASTSARTAFADKTIKAMAFSPDQAYLAASGPKEVVLWKIATAEVVGRFSCIVPPRAMKFSPEGKELLCATPGSWERWDPLTAKRRAFSADTTNGKGFTLIDPLAMILTSDGRRAVVARGPIVTTWPLAGKTTPESRVHDETVASLKVAIGGSRVALSPSGKWLAWSDLRKNKIRVYSLAPLELRWELPADAASATFAWSPDDSSLAVLSTGQLKLCGASDGKELASFGLAHAAYQKNLAMCFALDGRRVFFGLGSDVVVWNATVDSTVRSWPAASVPLGLGGAIAMMGRPIWSADGAAALGWGEEAVHCTNGPLGKSSPEAFGLSAAMFPDSTGKLPAVFWNRDGDTPAKEWTIPKGHLTGFSVSPDRALVALACKDGKVVLVDGKTRIVRRTIQAADSPSEMQKAVLAPKGSWLATASLSLRRSDTTVRVWDYSTGNELAKLPHVHRVLGFEFCPISDELFTFAFDANSKRSEIVKWDWRNEVVRWRSDVNGVVSSLSINSDGRRLAYTDLQRVEGSIEMLDAVTGRTVFALNNPSKSPVFGVSFSPNGKWLVARGPNQFTVWSAAD